MRGAAVQFTLKGLSAEKLLNEIRKRGIPLLQAKRLGGRGMQLRCAPGHYRAIRAMAEEKGYEAGPPQPVGWYRWVLWGKGRWPLLLGALVCAGMAVYALGFVWHIQIAQAGPYEGEVRAFLREAGIRPGLRRSGINLQALREQLEWRLPQVKWVRTQWQGVALRVTLEQGTPPPDIETNGGAGDVVADRDGLLLRLTAFAGTPRARAGDFVRAGQVLIAGEERGEGGAMRPVKARGDALARVWTVRRVRMPMTQWRSIPTGREARRRVLLTPWGEMAFQAEPDFLCCDRDRQDISLGGAWWPVMLRRETHQEIYLEEEKREENQVLREAEGAAMRLLNQGLKNAETVDKWINFRMIKGDTVVVEAAAEQIARIGRCRKTTGGSNAAP